LNRGLIKTQPTSHYDLVFTINLSLYDGEI
jgi:hypothetical protein